MALHTQLSIYKTAYALFDVITDLSKNMPRDFKVSIGGKLRDECVAIMVLIFRANVSREKVGHIETLIERLQIAELLLRLSCDKRLISKGQYAKHQIGARHYIRYVDDFLLLHPSAQWLNCARADIEAFLPRVLNARLNPKKTILQPIDRGVDFVGHVIKPHHTSTRRRTVRQAVRRIQTMPTDDVYASANSYFGLLRQASLGHADRALLARAVMARGHAVNKKFTKTYRKTSK